MPGAIVKRSATNYAVKVYVGQGKSKWYSGFRTRREAQAFQVSMASNPLHAAGMGLYGSIRLRLGTYLTSDWLPEQAARVKRGTLKVRTLERYDELARTHIIPRIGWVPLVKVSPQQVKGLYRAMFDGGRSPSTVRRVAMVLHKAFEDARREGLVGQNPVDYSDPPQNARFEPRLWSDEQVALFLGEARRSSKHYTLYLTAIASGARIGELLAARWEDFRAMMATLSVRHTLTRPKGGGVLLDTPKSANARRDIVLPLEAVEALEALRKQQAQERLSRETCPKGATCRNAACKGWHEFGLTFTQANGKPLHAKKIAARSFRRTVGRAGLPLLRLHDLRHLHGSYLVRHGASVKLVQERLGHSTPAFTMRTYIHNAPGQQAEAVRLISVLLEPATHLQPNPGMMNGEAASFTRG